MRANKPTFYKIVVQGKGIFPTDMLRYDQCFPISERDSCTIEDSGELRTIELGCSTCRLQPATTARWNSFNWQVLSVEPV